MGNLTSMGTRQLELRTLNREANVLQRVGLFFSIMVMGFLVGAANSSAEVRKGEIMFGPYGLYSIPTDDYPSPRLDDVPAVDLGPDVEPSPGLGGAVDRVMSTHLSLGGEFKVYFGTVDEEVLQDFLDNHVPTLDEAEVTWRTVHFGARARYFLSPEKSVNPFLQGGAGIYVSKLRAEFRQIRGSGTTNDFSRSESFTNPGVSVGAGTLMRISKDTRASVDAIFTNIFTEGRNVRYLGFSLGLLFSVTPQ